jgi:CheY-like chemotaxis protein
MTANVLVIDDDDALRFVLSSMLKHRGYTVRTSPGVRHALMLIEEEPPDVICCDLMMPAVSGLEFLEMRQEDEKLKKIPVIVISASGIQEMIQESITLGADAHLAKPIGTNDLVSQIETVVNKAQDEEKTE